MDERTPVTLLVAPAGGAAWCEARAAGTGKAALLWARREAFAGSHGLTIPVSGRKAPSGWGCACCGEQGGVAHALRGLLPRARRQDIRHVFVAVESAAEADTVVVALRDDPAVAAAYRLAGTDVAAG